MPDIEKLIEIGIVCEICWAYMPDVKENGFTPPNHTRVCKSCCDEGELNYG